jgi:hypothetical protein
MKRQPRPTLAAGITPALAKARTEFGCRPSNEAVCWMVRMRVMWKARSPHGLADVLRAEA